MEIHLFIHWSLQKGVDWTKHEDNVKWDVYEDYYRSEWHSESEFHARELKFRMKWNILSLSCSSILPKQSGLLTFCLRSYFIEDTFLMTEEKVKFNFVMNFGKSNVNVWWWIIIFLVDYTKESTELIMTAKLIVVLRLQNALL